MRECPDCEQPMRGTRMPAVWLVTTHPAASRRGREAVETRLFTSTPGQRLRGARPSREDQGHVGPRKMIPAVPWTTHRGPLPHRRRGRRHHHAALRRGAGTWRCWPRCQRMRMKRRSAPGRGLLAVQAQLDQGAAHRPAGESRAAAEQWRGALMPWKPKRPCRVTACQELQPCPQHPIAGRRWDGRGSTTARGYGWAWQQQRKAALVAGRDTPAHAAAPATRVDHVAAQGERRHG